MGLFSTIGNSVFFIRSAQKINDYQKQIAFLVNKNQYATVIPQHDKMQILGYDQQIEDVAIEMRNKLNSLSPQEQFSIMVPCLDGHSTAVPGFVMASMAMVEALRTDLKNM